jgi:hypothetical protein
VYLVTRDDRSKQFTFLRKRKFIDVLSQSSKGGFQVLNLSSLLQWEPENIV